MRLSLFDGINAYVQAGAARLHMPGHKGKATLDILSGIMPFDVTELPETDSLFEADGIIEQSQRDAARAVGTKRLFYSAGGCTLCIQAMIRLACRPGGKIIMSRRIHRSAINTLALLDIEPVWVMPSGYAGDGFTKYTTAGDVEAVLRDNRDAQAVYVTSPDYYGVMSDIAGISRVCKRYGVPLIVDNAHGAHFSFMQGGKLHPIANGADMSADSAHKSLPVLTGGAYLCVNNDKYEPGAQQAMTLFGSTSPSYPIMLSIESGIAWAERSEHRFEETADILAEIRKSAQRAGFMLPQGLIDPLKLTIDTAQLGMSGFDAQQYFRSNGIQCEMSDSRRVVFMASPFNDAQDFVSLEGAIKRFPKAAAIAHGKYDVALPKRVMTVRQAALSDSEALPLKNCVGRVAAQASCPCPPGIPVIMPGEIVDSFVMESLNKYGILQLMVVK